MIRNGIHRGDIQRAARRIAERLGRKRIENGGHIELGFETVADAWSALEHAKKRVTLVFREGEALLAEMEASGQLPCKIHSFTRCIRVPNGGHTLRPLWAQKLVHDIIDGEVATVIRAAEPASVGRMAGSWL